MRPDLGQRAAGGQGPLRLVAAGLLAAVAQAGAAAAAQGPPPAAPPHLEIAGLVVGVTDLAAATAFYSRILGFAPESPEAARGASPVRLRLGPVELRLRQVEMRRVADPDRAANVYVNVQVPEIAATSRELSAGGFAPLRGELRSTAIGVFASLTDPAGNLLQIVEQRPRPPAVDKQVFNIAVRVTSMDDAKAFYCRLLGFSVLSESHPPPIIPLRKQGAVPLILHESAAIGVETDYPREGGTALLLRADEPQAVAAYLAAHGVEMLPPAPGLPLAFRDPFGNVVGVDGSGQDPTPPGDATRRRTGSAPAP
jgi:catechol 2,3-dioxygenase-like lactoylglutathione lyase family enzyme